MAQLFPSYTGFWSLLSLWQKRQTAWARVKASCGDQSDAEELPIVGLAKMFLKTLASDFDFTSSSVVLLS